jgi:glutamyl-tRNA synthetase
MDDKTVRTRIAPSPTGAPHIATLYSVIMDYAFAKQQNGQFIWRIEDTDNTRYVEGSIEKLKEALEWSGLEADEDNFKGGPYGPYIQSKRLDIYRRYAEELIAKGNAYYCFCTKERLEALRAEQIKNKQQPMYDKHCYHLTKEEIDERLDRRESYVIRLDVPINEKIIVHDLLRGDITFDTNQIDDQVLLKSDGFPTYHLAVIVDDHLMHITHVVRGEEWLPSTPKHILLYRYFGWTPTYFAHTQILRNPDHSKMSKRKGDTSILLFKEKGYLPEALVNYLGLLGNPNKENKEIFDLDYLIENFDFKRIPLTGPVFDVTKLEWMNGVYIRNMSREELAERLKPFLHIDISKKPEIFYVEAVGLIQERIKRLDEGDALLELFYTEPKIDLKVKKDTIKDLLKITEDFLDNAERMEAKIREYAAVNNMKAGEVFMLLRDAVTGKKATPPLIPVMQVLGKEESVKRIKKSIGE